ncbi:MAG: glycosyltransferase [Cyanobacteria bacterium P01_F01_bin.150]
MSCSIIIPVYNGAFFLSQAIDSIIQQGHNLSEIIIVDDGSTDNSQDIVQPYLKQNNVRYIYQQNQGVAAARNRGMEIVNGEYVAFLDQDDLFLPQKLEKTIQVFEQYPEVGIVHSGWRRINKHAHPIVDVRPWENIAVLDLHEWLLRMPVLFSAMFFRREWLEKARPLDTQFIQACDVDLVQRLALMGCPTVWLKEITVCYRQHDRNESLKTLLQAQESWEVRNKFFARSDLPPSIRAREAEYRYHTLVWIAWRLFITQHLAEACQYLKQSLQYSPYSATQTPLNWLKGFETMSRGDGYPFNPLTLLDSSEWQNLLQYAL